MAKIICCDKCKSINVKEIGEERTNQHMTKDSGFWGLGGSFETNYIYHFNLYKEYECTDCMYKFKELEYSC